MTKKAAPAGKSGKAAPAAQAPAAPAPAGGIDALRNQMQEVALKNPRLAGRVALRTQTDKERSYSNYDGPNSSRKAYEFSLKAGQTARIVLLTDIVEVVGYKVTVGTFDYQGRKLPDQVLFRAPGFKIDRSDPLNPQLVPTGKPDPIFTVLGMRPDVYYVGYLLDLRGRNMSDAEYRTWVTAQKQAAAAQGKAFAEPAERPTVEVIKWFATNQTQWLSHVNLAAQMLANGEREKFLAFQASRSTDNKSPRLGDWTMPSDAFQHAASLEKFTKEVPGFDQAFPLLADTDYNELMKRHIMVCRTHNFGGVDDEGAVLFDRHVSHGESLPLPGQEYEAVVQKAGGFQTAPPAATTEAQNSDMASRFSSIGALLGQGEAVETAAPKASKAAKASKPEPEPEPEPEPAAEEVHDNPYQLTFEVQDKQGYWFRDPAGNYFLGASADPATAVPYLMADNATYVDRETWKFVDADNADTTYLDCADYVTWSESYWPESGEEVGTPDAETPAYDTTQLEGGADPDQPEDAQYEAPTEPEPEPEPAPATKKGGKRGKASAPDKGTGPAIVKQAPPEAGRKAAAVAPAAKTGKAGKVGKASR